MENDKRNDKKSEIEVEELQQYVTFVIGKEVYGVEVHKVHQIIGMTKITHVPNSLSFMKGMINLRGSVMPVVDMRMKFEMEEKEYNTFTVILIVELKNRFIGMIVDSVSDVLEVPITSIHDTPHFSAKIDTDYIRGIGSVEEDLIIILDVDMILTTEELKHMDETGPKEKIA